MTYPPARVLQVVANLVLRYENDVNIVRMLGSPNGLRKMLTLRGRDHTRAEHVVEYISELGYAERALEVLNGTLKPKPQAINLPKLGNRKLIED